MPKSIILADGPARVLEEYFKFLGYDNLTDFTSCALEILAKHASNLQKDSGSRLVLYCREDSEEVVSPIESDYLKAEATDLRSSDEEKTEEESQLRRVRGTIPQGWRVVK